MFFLHKTLINSKHSKISMLVLFDETYKQRQNARKKKAKKKRQHDRKRKIVLKRRKLTFAKKKNFFETKITRDYVKNSMKVDKKNMKINKILSITINIKVDILFNLN